jgi:hypothetical protein
MTDALATYKGFVVNGTLEEWSGGVPVDFEIAQANTTVVQLQKEQQGLHRAGQKQFEVQETLDLAPNIPIAANPLVKEGNSALRFRGAAALAAGEFAIRTEGITAALSGAATGQVFPYAAAQESVFSFWARGTENAEFAVNLVILTEGGVVLTFVESRLGGGSWQNAVIDSLVFEATPIWTQYAIPFWPLANSGPPNQDGVRFEITNVSTGPFILDIDDIEYEVRDEANQRPV